MLFDKEFFDSLPDNPHRALFLMCKKVLDWERDTPSTVIRKEYDEYSSILAAIVGVLKATSIQTQGPKITADREESVRNIRGFINKLYTQIDVISADDNLSSIYNKYKERFTPEFAYQFTDGDIEQIQKLINELRDQISQSKILGAKHKQRLFNKLEALQKELHKTMDSLDKFWNLLSDVWTLSHKHADKARPYIELIIKILMFAWVAERGLAELPSSIEFPQLPIGPEDK